jgi:hypothetical protein
MKPKFSWSPKLTFISAIFAVLLVISGYLSYQYVNFVKPPELTVITPAEGEVIRNKNLTVSGKTNSQAVVKVNNQPVLVDENGNFLDTIEIYEKTNEIEIKAISRSGEETIIIRKIVPDLNSGN